MTTRQFRADADGASFVGEQLRYISPDLVQIVFADPEWALHLPLETGNNPAVEEMGFDVFTAAGMAELFRGDGWNLPEVATARERIMARVYDYGINRTMTDLAIEQANLNATMLRAMGQTNPVTVDREKEIAAATAIASKHNEIALNGEPALNIFGLVNQPNVSNYPAPNGESASALWEDKTGPEIVADLTGLVSMVMTTAKNATWFPDRLLLPLNKSLIASSKTMPGTVESALSFFQRTNPMGTRLKISSWQRLNGQGTGSTGLAFAYKFDESVLSYRAPRAYHVHTPPARSPTAWTWTHSMRSAGVAVKRPFAIGKMQGF